MLRRALPSSQPLWAPSPPHHQVVRHLKTELAGLPTAAERIERLKKLTELKKSKLAAALGQLNKQEHGLGALVARTNRSCQGGEVGSSGVGQGGAG